MPLINCEINLILTWSENCFIIAGAIANEVPKFAITDSNFIFRLILYQLKIMPNYYNNWNQVLRLRLLNWSNFFVS